MGGIAWCGGQCSAMPGGYSIWLDSLARPRFCLLLPHPHHSRWESGWIVPDASDRHWTPCSPPTPIRTRTFVHACLYAQTCTDSIYTLTYAHADTSLTTCISKHTHLHPQTHPCVHVRAHTHSYWAPLLSGPHHFQSCFLSCLFMCQLRDSSWN